jgi:hypothetical protein
MLSPQAYTAANEAIFQEAILLVADRQQRTVAAVVWDGLSRGEDHVTVSFLQSARHRDFKVLSVPTR